MKRLQGKVAIVTGASSGIGYETARLFAAEGAAVVASARRTGALDALVDSISADGGAAIAVTGDVRDPAVAEAQVATAQEHFGGLDIAFNNAGMTGAPTAIQDISLGSWRETIDTNLTAAFLGAKSQIPAMLARGGGSIVFTSTFVGYTTGFPGMAAYAAGKAGLIGLTQVLASEFGPDSIRVNALLPGGTDTPMGQASTPTPESRAFVEGLHALKRLAQPEEIARSALHLVSDDASFVTGTAFLVDGGVSITRT